MQTVVLVALVLAVANAAVLRADPTSCSLFQCPPNTVIVANASTVLNNGVNQCCLPACSAYICVTPFYVLLANAAQIAGSADATCCFMPLCSGFACPVNFLAIGNATLQGNNASTCCVPACSLYQCPDNTIPLDAANLSTNVALIPQTTPGGCCVFACSVFQCPVGYQQVANANAVAGQSVWPCCVQTCAIFTGCVGNFVLVPTNIGLDAMTCCATTCNGVTCPTDYLRNPTNALVVSSDPDVCCVLACSGYQCPAGQVLVPGAAQLAGPLTAVCCQAAR